jgi:uncharacterized protein
MVLAFALGFLAALARSDLSFPEAAAKFLSIYLLFAIGFKGGVSVNESGLDARLALALVAGSRCRRPSRSSPSPPAGGDPARRGRRRRRRRALRLDLDRHLRRRDRRAQRAGHRPRGFMVAVAAAMEAPAILVALWLASRARPSAPDEHGAALMREILLNGSIVLLVGAFAIGWITGPEGRAEIAPFIDAPFRGILCLFLLDMGLVAGRGMRQSLPLLEPRLIAFGLLMPLLGAAIALPVALLLGLSQGGAALLMTLAASASYIAVPAAMRVALPEANPSIYLTLSLGITFPFNLTLGIPLYLGAAGLFAG